MKVIMKLLITIIVVAVVGFTVGFLLMNGAKKVEPEKVEEVPEIKIPEKEESGENWEIVSNDSGDAEEEQEQENIVHETKEDIISRIEEQVRMNAWSGEEESMHDDLTLDLVNDSAKDFMKYFKQNTISVTVKKGERMIEIIPDTDFVNNMIYHFDENGELILYESVSQTVEGSCKYYFDNGKGIGIAPKFEEGVDYQEELISDILNRSKLLYDKYL